ncbi:MAG: hypothetical protein Q9216_001942 [Gyalolechia sp. 2 TL-2023]
MAPLPITSPLETKPSRGTFALCLLCITLGTFASIFDVAWLTIVIDSLITGRPTPLMGSKELCPEHATLPRTALTVFTHCATHADFLFVAGLLTTIGGIAVWVIAWRLHVKQHEKGQAEAAAAAEAIELPSRRARSAVDDDEERTIGISTPAPAYNPASPSSASSFTLTPSSTASESNFLPLYESPRRAPTYQSPGASMDWVPGRVDSEGEQTNDWRGKWNNRVGRMGR